MTTDPDAHRHRNIGTSIAAIIQAYPNVSTYNEFATRLDSHCRSIGSHLSELKHKGLDCNIAQSRTNATGKQSFVWMAK